MTLEEVNRLLVQASPRPVIRPSAREDHAK
jgi:hypothetical protein